MTIKPNARVHKEVLNFLLSFIFIICVVSSKSQNLIDSLKTAAEVSNGIAKARVFEELGMAYWHEREFEQAYNYLEKSLEIYGTDNHFSERGQLLSMMGKIKTDLSEYDVALKDLLEGLRLFEKTDDDENLLILLNRIGIVYLELSEEVKALAYFEKVLAIAERNADSNKIASIINNIGIIHAHMGNHEKAITYFKKTLEILKKRKDKFSIAIFNNNIGVQYFRQDKYREALSYYQKSIDILEELPDKNLLAEAYNNAGEALIYLSRYNEAESYLKKALVAGEQSGEKVSIQDTYLYLTQLYETSGNASEALFYHKKYSNLKDSIFSERKAEQIAKLETMYETEQKENQIEQLHYQTEIQKIKLENYQQTKWLLLFSSGLILIIVIIVIFSYRRKIKTGRILKAKNKELDLYAKQVSKTDLLRRELISNVSHDLRSPLSIIHGYIETLLIKENELTTGQRTRYLQIVLDSSKRLKHLVSDLFDLSKLEAKQIDLNPENFYISELINDTTQQYLLLAKNKNLSLHSNISNSVPMIKADISLMQRVIQNLLSNAIQYTPESGEIYLNVQPVGDQVEVNILNTGTGIPDDELPHIFNRYYKVDKNKSEIKGSGLGLAIVKKILDLHKFPIEVKSEAGQYASFTFRIPVNKPV